MATQLEDHNQGQKDGANAGFMDTMAANWNPLLSSAYKQGFRHAVEQQSKKAQEQIPLKQSESGAFQKRPSAIDEDNGVPLVLSLFLVYFVFIISGAFFLLRWTIQRPGRVAVGLLIVVGIAISSRQAAPRQEAAVRVSEAPASVSLPTAASTSPSARQEASGGPTETRRREATPASDGNSQSTAVISQYWLAVGAEDYKVAWSLLSSNFRNKNHAGEYDNYVRARQGMHVCSVMAEGLEPRESLQDSAVVEGTVIFKAGSMCRESKERFSFYLINDGRQGWLIDRVARR